LEKKLDIDIKDEEYIYDKKRPKKTTLASIDKLNQYKAWLLQLTICDPACGSGAFLNQALDFLIKEHKYIDELQAKLLGEALVFSDIEKSILENNLYGVDINEESVEIAKLSLWLRTAQPNRKLNDLNNNIKCGNSLIDDPDVAGEKAFNWQNEFPEVFSKGGFDVVIGNPPYGAYFDEKSKIYLPKEFKTFQGNFEIYFFFIEILNKLVKSLGKVGYICPDTWINIPQAQKLREHVLQNYGINTIISFHYSVFSDASVNAIIFILTRDNFYENCEFINVSSNNNTIENLSNTTKCNVSNWKKSKDKQFQIWQNESDIDIIKKIQRNIKLGEEVLDISQGIVPYSKENLTEEQVKQRIYHKSEKLNEDFGDWVQGRALLRYGIDLTNKEYLKYGRWLHRPRKAKYFNGKRILIQEITGGNPPRIKATIFNGLLYHDPGIIACLNKSAFNLEYILAIINSKLISWYNLKTAPKGKRTTFPKVLISDIRNIPFANSFQEIQIKLSEKVKSILSLNKMLQESSEKFKNIITRKFALIELSIKMQYWYMYSYADFIKELLKSKIKLSLKEEAEWEEYFNAERKKALDILAEIESTDKEIDQMVYKLYELTEEEIKIVEES
jgi:type I restriction-modification system DNA methylase subunit